MYQHETRNANAGGAIFHKWEVGSMVADGDLDIDPCLQASLDASEIARFHDGGREFSLACLSHIDDLKNLQDAWQTLESNTQESFIYFQSHAWCYEWCVHHLASDAISRKLQLHVYVLRSQGAVAMILPMAAVRSRSGATLLVTLTDPLAQYSNVLVDRTLVSEQAGRKAWNLVCKHASVDAITLNNCPAGSFLDRISAGYGYLERSNSAAAILDLTEFKTWQDYEASLSRSNKKNRRRRRAKLEKEGNLAYEVASGGTDRYRELIRQTLSMKRTWLESTGRSSNTISSGLTEDFLASLLGRKRNAYGNPEGAFAHALTLDGRPIATEIGFVMDRHYYSFLGAFDLDWQDYSPGKVQIESAQKWAKSAGIWAFDFLGDPSSYKLNWTGSNHPLHSRAVPLTTLGILYCSLWKSLIRPALKSAHFNMSPDLRRFVAGILSFPGSLAEKRLKIASETGVS